MKRKKNSPTHKMMFFARMNGSRGKEVLDAQFKDYKGLYIQHDGYGLTSMLEND